jgi:hypothetical protein
MGPKGVPDTKTDRPTDRRSHQLNSGLILLLWRGCRIYSYRTSKTWIVGFLPNLVDIGMSLYKTLTLISQGARLCAAWSGRGDEWMWSNGGMAANTVKSNKIRGNPFGAPVHA